MVLLEYIHVEFFWLAPLGIRSIQKNSIHVIYIWLVLYLFEYCPKYDGQSCKGTIMEQHSSHVK
jgi:hypothetical protein